MKLPDLGDDADDWYGGTEAYHAGNVGALQLLCYKRLIVKRCLLALAVYACMYARSTVSMQMLRFFGPDVPSAGDADGHQVS